MAADSRTTTDHEAIKRWAEERNAKPTVVSDTADDGGILRLNFPGYDSGDNLEEISWEQFFEIFDDRRLALLYQEETAEGEKSNFSKFVSRDD